MVTQTKPFSDKKLVKYLLDKKGVDNILIDKTKIVILVDKKFTPQDGLRLCQDVGRTEYKPFRKKDVNGIVFDRLG